MEKLLLSFDEKVMKNSSELHKKFITRFFESKSDHNDSIKIISSFGDDRSSIKKKRFVIPASFSRLGQKTT